MCRRGRRNIKVNIAYNYALIGSTEDLGMINLKFLNLKKIRELKYF